jgi:hypothetical protein
LSEAQIVKFIEDEYGTERTTPLDEFKVEPGTLVELQM